MTMRLTRFRSPRNKTDRRHEIGDRKPSKLNMGAEPKRDSDCGWSPEQFEAMNVRFISAVLRAIADGNEQPRQVA